MAIQHYERQVCANGMAYYQTGGDATIVLLHGVGLCIESWLQQIPTISQKYSIVALDLPGHGQSKINRLETLNSVEEFSRIITDSLQQLDVNPYAIVGHSLGALLALDIASRELLEVERVVAMSAIFERSQTATIAVQQRADELSEASKKPDSSATLNRWFGQNPTGEQAQYAELSQQWLEQCQREGYAAAYQAFARSNGPDRQMLINMRQPTLLLTGEKDPNSTPEMSMNMAAILPLGKHSVVKGAKHMLQLTHADAVNRALLDFLE